MHIGYMYVYISYKLKFRKYNIMIPTCAVNTAYVNYLHDNYNYYCEHFNVKFCKTEILYLSMN